MYLYALLLPLLFRIVAVVVGAMLLLAVAVAAAAAEAIKLLVEGIMGGRTVQVFVAINNNTKRWKTANCLP